MYKKIVNVALLTLGSMVGAEPIDEEEAEIKKLAKQLRAEVQAEVAAEVKQVQQPDEITAYVLNAFITGNTFLGQIQHVTSVATHRSTEVEITRVVPPTHFKKRVQHPTPENRKKKKPE